MINEAADEITDSLELELYGEVQTMREDRPSVLEDYDAVSSGWDSMIDQLIDRDMEQNGIDTDCICPACGLQNKRRDIFCVECGKRLDPIPEA